MSNDNQTPDEYQGKNGDEERLNRILRQYFSDQHWLDHRSQYYHNFLSYNVISPDEKIRLVINLSYWRRPARYTRPPDSPDTRNFGYDSRAEGDEDYL